MAVESDNGPAGDGHREVVRELEAQIAAAGDAFDPDAAVAVVRRAATLDLFASARALEELGTRLGSSSPAAPLVFEAIVQHPELSAVERAVAAVAAAIGLRRAGSPRASDRVLEQIDATASPWSYFPALILHLRSVNCLGSDVEDLRRGIRLSEEADRRLPNSPGILHARAHLMLEEAIWSNAAPEQRQQTLTEALSLVNRALVYADWPKFHFTRGRILLRLDGPEANIAAGLEELRAASANENKGAFDAAERRIHYSLELSLAEFRAAMREGYAEFDRKLRENVAELQKQSQATARLLEQQSEATAREVEQRSDAKARELEEKVLAESRTAQNQAITVIGFVVVALSLLPLSTSLFGFVESVGFPAVLLGVALYAVILFGAVALATWSLNHGFQKALRNLQESNQRLNDGDSRA